MSKIEQALLEVTGQKTEKKGEDRQKYLLRLALAANNKLTDAQWDSLEATEGAQDWVNAAVKADNDEKDIEDFPDLEDADEAGEDEADDESADDADEEEDEADEAEDDNSDEEEEEEVSTKPKKPAGKGASKPAPKAGKPDPKKAVKSDPKAKKADPKADKADGAPKKSSSAKSGAPKKDSMRRALKRIVVKHPKKSVDDLIDMLQKKGYDAPSKVTVTTIRADTRDTIRVMNEAELSDVEL